MTVPPVRVSEALNATEGRKPASAWRKTAAAARIPASEPWSASRLETYGSCPFQFFVKNALELEPRELPELGLDASQLGRRILV